jgi:hypothetical protein
LGAETLKSSFEFDLPHSPDIVKQLAAVAICPAPALRRTPSRPS